MQETSFKIDPKFINRFASLYSPLEGNSLTLIDHPDTTPYLKPSLLSGGGGLISTIDDYMKFGEMICAGGLHNNARIISSKTLNFMRLESFKRRYSILGAREFC